MTKNYFLVLVALLAAPMALYGAPDMRKAAGPQRLVNVTPHVLPASEITPTGFTANWESVAGAAGYAVFCYEPVTVQESGEYALVNETFNLVNVGSTVEPVWHEGFSCTLDKDYDFTFSPDWTVIGAAFAKGMVSGNLYTPYCDLTNDNGNYKLVLDMVAQMGTKIQVTSYGTTEETQTKVCTGVGETVLEFEFSNGAHDTYIYIVDMGIEGDDDGQYANVLSWFDQVSIVQNLSQGDRVLRLVDINEAVDAPNHSCRFDDMKFLYDARHLCYDLYAAFEYGDPEDWYDYEIDYSNYSALQEVDLPSSGISSPAIADSEQRTLVYDLQGRRVDTSADALPAGIYILRQDGTSRKLIVK